MKRKIVCKPLDDIELEFENGEVLTLRFDMLAMMEINDFSNQSIPELCAKIIYAGSHKAITEEKSRELVSQLNPSVIVEIINEFNDSMGILNNEVMDESIKKATAQFLMKMTQR